MAGFTWTEKAGAVALALAYGKTRAEAAREHDIAQPTLYRWLEAPEFNAEVDRLTLLVGISGRAQRVRITQPVARQLVRDGLHIKTAKDPLDWLKYAQGETDGITLDLAVVAEAVASVASGGSD